MMPGIGNIARVASRTAPDSLRLVQDLVNTLDIETGEDALTDGGGLGAFLHDHGVPAGRGGVTAPGEQQEAVGELQELREALREVCLAHTARAAVPETAPAHWTGCWPPRPLVLAVAPEGGAALRPAAGLRGAHRLTARGRRGHRDRGRGRHLDPPQGLRGPRLPLGLLRQEPGRPQPLVHHGAVCGSRAKMRTYRARRAESE